MLFLSRSASSEHDSAQRANQFIRALLIDIERIPVFHRDTFYVSEYRSLLD